MSKLSNNQVKVYRNPARKETQKIDKYVPQYVSLGLEPMKMASPSLPGKVLVARGGVTENNNPRTRQVGFQQPLVGIDQPNPSNQINQQVLSGQIPNVGNIEGVWMGLDGEIVDDVSDQNIDPNQPINDDSDNQAEVNSDDFELSSVEDDSYILYINGNIISYGPLEAIQNQVSQFVFGEHELCDGQPIPLENIVVLKKVKIKTGVFLDI